MEMTLKEEIIKILIDKLAVGGLLLLAGFIINKAIEKFKSAEALKNEIAKQRFATRLQLLERQLADFYWPIYLRLEKDNVIWKRILDQEIEDNDSLKKIGEFIEKDIIIPNHEEIIDIIESKIHLAQLDEDLSESLFLYINHVAVYKAAKAANLSGLHSTQRDLLPPWPKKLYPEIAKRTQALQDEYNNLLARYKNF
ncbi:hypothetical protein C7293_12550 [filamentous cyanobacterium CCT1]|nr:hypothetical protein C7293_12550 [filamentous cyanobacterium CCT1]PSN79823.1 hypothetical protein C8B47_09725 [filamentous cyanobacterium CCP4]